MNNSLIDVITPLNSPHEMSSIEIPGNGVLRIVIRDMGKPDGYLASLSVPLTILTTTAGIWLPLQESSMSDTIFQLSDDVKIPRMMLAIKNDVYEDELFLTSQDMEPDSITEIFLASEIVISQEPENLLLKTSNFNFETEGSESSKNQKVIDVLNLEIDNYKQSIKKEKEVNENLKKQISNLIETVKNNSNRANTREVSLLELINEKEIEIAKSLEINRKLQNLVRRLESDNRNTSEKLQRCMSQLENVEAIEKELNFYKESLKSVENNVEKLTSTMISLTNIDSCDNIPNVEKIVEKFDFSVNVDITSTEETENHKISLQDQNVKCFLQECIKKYSEVREITRLTEYVYKVNEIELNLAFTNDGIFVRHGLSLLDVEDYWNNRGKICFRRSDIPELGLSQVLHSESGGENNSKKTLTRYSPKKSILKSVCNLQQKYTTVLSKSSIKEIKPFPRKLNK